MYCIYNTLSAWLKCVYFSPKYNIYKRREELEIFFKHGFTTSLLPGDDTQSNDVNKRRRSLKLSAVTQFSLSHNQVKV